MKASIFSLLITLLILSVASSSCSEKAQSPFHPNLVVHETGERLGTDLSLDDNDNSSLASANKPTQLTRSFVQESTDDQHLSTEYHNLLSIRAPPVAHFC